MEERGKEGKEPREGDKEGKEGPREGDKEILQVIISSNSSSSFFLFCPFAPFASGCPSASFLLCARVHARTRAVGELGRDNSSPFLIDTLPYHLHRPDASTHTEMTDNVDSEPLSSMTIMQLRNVCKAKGLKPSSWDLAKLIVQIEGASGSSSGAPLCECQTSGCSLTRSQLI